MNLIDLCRTNSNTNHVYAICPNIIDQLEFRQTYRHPCVPHPLHECMLSCFSRVQLFATLRTVAHQDPLSMGLSRQE